MLIGFPSSKNRKGAPRVHLLKEIERCINIFIPPRSSARLLGSINVEVGLQILSQSSHQPSQVQIEGISGSDFSIRMALGEGLDLNSGRSGTNDSLLRGVVSVIKEEFILLIETPKVLSDGGDSLGSEVSEECSLGDVFSGTLLLSLLLSEVSAGLCGPESQCQGLLVLLVQPHDFSPSVLAQSL